MSQLIGIIDDEEVTDSDREIELRILSFLNYSKLFTQDIHKELNPKQFSIPEVKDIAAWIVKFYEENKKVPQGHIKDIINDKKLQFKRFNELHEIVIDALEDPNKESNLDPEYMLKTAREYLLSRQLYNSLFNAQALLKEKRPDEAIKAIKEELRTVNQTDQSIIISSPLNEEAFNKTVEMIHDPAQVLFRLPGALGDFIGNITRGSFISLLGIEKVGKTSNLIGLTKQALLNRLKVSFVSVGDASDQQLRQRLYACCFKKAYNPKYFNKPTRYPVKDCLKNQTGNCGKMKNKITVSVSDFYKYKDRYKPCEKWCEKCTPAFWYKEIIAKPLSNFKEDSKFFAKRMRNGNWHNNLRTYVFGQWSKTIEDIKDMLDEDTDRTGFIPDVLLIDYMDDLNFESSDGLREFRHKNAKLWGKTRAMSIDRNIAIITATQANRGAYNKETLDGEDQSEDKRKKGYVTAMYGLNQTDDDKRNQIMRYSCLAQRDAEFITKDTITTLQCLTLGQPWIFSFITPKTEEKKK